MLTLRTLLRVPQDQFISQTIVGDTLYQVPLNSTYGKLLEYNLNTGQYFEYQISYHTYRNQVYVPDIGKLYLVPSSSNYICEFDILTKQIQYYSVSQNGFANGVYHDGKIVMIPQNGTKIGVFDVYKKTFTTIGDYSSVSSFRWGQQVKVGNVLYAPPLNQSSVLKMNLDTLNVTMIGSLSGSDKWCSSVYFEPLNRVYFIPQQSTQILELDVSTDSLSLFGSITISQSFAYGSQQVINDLIYILPTSMNNIIILDPYTRSYTFTNTFTSVQVDNYGWGSTNLVWKNKTFLIPRKTQELLEVTLTPNTEFSVEDKIIDREIFYIHIPIREVENLEVVVPLKTPIVSNYIEQRKVVSQNLNVGIPKRIRYSNVTNPGRSRTFRYGFLHSNQFIKNVVRHSTVFDISKIGTSKVDDYVVSWDFSNVSKRLTLEHQVSYDFYSKTKQSYNYLTLFDLQKFPVKRNRAVLLTSIGFRRQNRCSTKYDLLREVITKLNILKDLIVRSGQTYSQTFGVYLSSSTFQISRNRLSMKKVVSSYNSMGFGVLFSQIKAVQQFYNVQQDTQVTVATNFSKLVELGISSENLTSIFMLTEGLLLKQLNVQYNPQKEFTKEFSFGFPVGTFIPPTVVQNYIVTGIFRKSYINFLNELLQERVLELSTNKDIGDENKIRISNFLDFGMGYLSILHFFTEVVQETVLYKSLHTEIIQIYDNVLGLLNEIGKLLYNISGTWFWVTRKNWNRQSFEYDFDIQRIILSPFKYDLQSLITRKSSFGTNIGKFDRNRLSVQITPQIGYRDLLQNVLEVVRLKLQISKYSFGFISEQNRVRRSIVSLNLGYQSSMIIHEIFEIVKFTVNSITFDYSLEKHVEKELTKILEIGISTQQESSFVTDVQTRYLNSNYHTLKLKLSDFVRRYYSILNDLLEYLKDYHFTVVSVNNYVSELENIFVKISVNKINPTDDKLLSKIDVLGDKVRRNRIPTYKEVGFYNRQQLNDELPLTFSHLKTITVNIPVVELYDFVSSSTFHVNYRILHSQKFDNTFNVVRYTDNYLKVSTEVGYQYENDTSNLIDVGKSTLVDSSNITEVGKFDKYIDISVDTQVGYQNLNWNSFIYLMESLWIPQIGLLVSLGIPYEIYPQQVVTHVGFRDRCRLSPIYHMESTNYVKEISIRFETGHSLTFDYSNIVDVWSSEVNITSVKMENIWERYNTISIITDIGVQFWNILTLLKEIGTVFFDFLSNILYTGYGTDKFISTISEIGTRIMYKLSDVENLEKPSVQSLNVISHIGKYYLNNLDFVVTLGELTRNQTSQIVDIQKFVWQYLSQLKVSDFLVLVIKQYGQLQQIQKVGRKFLSKVIQLMSYKRPRFGLMSEILRENLTEINILTEVQNSIIRQNISTLLQQSSRFSGNYHTLKLKLQDQVLKDLGLLSEVGLYNENILNNLFELLSQNQISLSTFISIVYYHQFLITGTLELISLVDKVLGTNIYLTEYGTILPSIKLKLSTMEQIRANILREKLLIKPIPNTYLFTKTKEDEISEDIYEVIIRYFLIYNKRNGNEGE